MKYIILIAFLMLGAITEEIYITSQEQKGEYILQLAQANRTINLLENHYMRPETFPYLWPIVTEDYKKISSFYGYRNNPLRENIGSIDMKDHYAVDVTGVQGARVQAVWYGEVVEKWYERGWHLIDGKLKWFRGHPKFNGCVVIRLDNGMLALNGHVSDITVHEGDMVIPGQEIARINPEKDENSTGPHLHFALADEEGNPIQPLNYIKEPE